MAAFYPYLQIHFTPCSLLLELDYRSVRPATLSRRLNCGFNSSLRAVVVVIRLFQVSVKDGRRQSKCSYIHASFLHECNNLGELSCCNVLLSLTVLEQVLKVP